MNFIHVTSVLDAYIAISSARKQVRLPKSLEKKWRGYCLLKPRSSGAFLSFRNQK